jgi:hypothetical protein
MMIANRQPLDWPALRAWSEHEGMDPTVIEKLREHAIGA